ncbi:uncharacterized protein LOC128155296 isoform X1 [Crassostrea angulata]|uniref:uncharacterized protein LOC128155296 isoform X1 n=1 Tax=Magallana angulata TaxID=2784310 RepID=UPI0022B0E1B2|nr:uncharacterized protein LOC128155296 isoform X1 [Crassostrea angulata]
MNGQTTRKVSKLRWCRRPRIPIAVTRGRCFKFLIGLLCTCMVILLVKLYFLGQQKRIENNNSTREKLASVTQRKMIPAKFLQEESCEIETALYYLGNHTNITIENYKDPFANFTPIGGNDWTFSSTVDCLQKTSNFKKSIMERNQFYVGCSKNDVYMNLTHMSSDSTDQVFQFPSNCLRRVISKYCTDNSTVPNIVHYIWFGSLSFEFMHFVSFLSAYKYQNPCMILFFHDMLPSGIWWNLLRQTVPNFVLVRVTPPTHISGRKIKFIQHKADIFRLQILKEYGGIYLDTDQYILRSLDEFRNNECTMGVAHDGSVGSALIIAARNSRFVQKWIESYRSYDPESWGGNSVTMAKRLAEKFPDLVRLHRHHCMFFPHGLVLYNQNYKWSHSYAIHIFKTGHFDMLKSINFDTVQKLNNTIGAFFRYILYDDKELCRT